MDKEETNQLQDEQNEPNHQLKAFLLKIRQQSAEEEPVGSSSSVPPVEAPLEPVSTSQASVASNESEKDDQDRGKLFMVLVLYSFYKFYIL